MSQKPTAPIAAAAAPTPTTTTTPTPTVHSLIEAQSRIWREELRTLIMEYNDSQIRCPTCGKIFEFKYQLKTHKVDEHSY